MTEVEKRQIAEQLRQFSERVGSQNKTARMLDGVSTATVSKILTGKWETIGDEMWRGIAATLVDMSIFVDQHPILLFSILPIIVTIVLFTFPYWKGAGRATADKIPPWSIYRTFIGVSWLLALSALVRAGMPVSRAVRSLMGNDTSHSC